MGWAKPIDGYFHCDGDNCKFKSKKRTSLVFFHGKFLCPHCKLKCSKATGDILHSNASWITIKKEVKLKDIGVDYHHLEKGPQQHRIGFLKVTEPLKIWASKQKDEPISQREEPTRAFWVGFDRTEKKLLWSHFAKQKLSEREIAEKIHELEEQNTKAHLEYKRGLREKKPDFQEEFRKLQEKRI